MNVLQLNPERNGLVQFTNEYSYNHQSSPPDSVTLDSSDTSQQKIVESVYLNTWEGTGEFPDCGDVKDIVLFKESQEPVIEDVKEVVAFHHLPRNVCPTICAVCGDRATGYHYEVPSCNGCKTFFRRTVLSQRKYDCIRGGKCFNVLPKEKRCSCRSCRFKKCVEVGMNPLAIQTNDSLNGNTLVSKIVSKRKVSDSETPSTSKTLIPTDVISIDQSIDKLIDGLVYLEIKVEEFRKCSFNPPNEQYTKLNSLLDQHSLIALADRCGPMPNWPLGQLTKEEWHAFREKGSFEPMSKDRKNWFVYDILTSVEYAKTFMFMHKIGREDQIRLLKSVVLKLMHLNQSYYSYENKRDMIIHPDGTSPQFPKHVFESIGISSSQKTDEDRQRFLAQICASILALMRNRLDKKEYVLFKAITLCNATVPGLSERCREIVTEEKQKFTNALLKYCLANRGANGPAHFAACLALSTHLENHQKNTKDFHVLIKMMKSTKGKRHGHPAPCAHELVEDVMEE